MVVHDNVQAIIPWCCMAASFFDERVERRSATVVNRSLERGEREVLHRKAELHELGVVKVHPHMKMIS